MFTEAIHTEATTAARTAASDFLTKHGDRDCCGFAWVTVYDVKLSSKDGKAFKAMGFDKAYGGGIQLWNPSGIPTQSITAKEDGSRAYANILQANGYKAYAGSRMD